MAHVDLPLHFRSEVYNLLRRYLHRINHVEIGYSRKRTGLLPRAHVRPYLRSRLTITNAKAKHTKSESERKQLSKCPLFTQRLRLWKPGFDWTGGTRGAWWSPRRVHFHAPAACLPSHRTHRPTSAQKRVP